MNETAALLVNLGSPDSTSVKDVKRYLDEFLMDDHVIDLPYLPRALLVKGIILNTRPARSAAAYQSIWLRDGSPLIVYSKKLHRKVQEQTSSPVGLAMRYGNPSIRESIAGLLKEHPGISRLFVIPLYPQFAMSSYETVQHKTEEVCRRYFPGLSLQFKAPFYNEQDYLHVLASSIKANIQEDHHLLLSYHGVPLRHLQKSDPGGNHCLKSTNCCSTPSLAHQTCYRHQCFETSQLLAALLQLNPDQWSLSFQSRLGRDEWLKPYTAETLSALPEKGIKKLMVACPAFVSDCLETLEEINKEGRHIFMQAGGESFISLPCLNDDSAWSSLLARWINESQAPS